MYSATRFRVHESVNLLGQALGSLTPHDKLFNYIANLVVASSINPNQTYQFRSWPKLYAAHGQLGANMLSLCANFNFTRKSTPNALIRGFGVMKANETSPLFAAENILIVR